MRSNHHPILIVLIKLYLSLYYIYIIILYICAIYPPHTIYIHIYNIYKMSNSKDFNDVSDEPALLKEYTKFVYL